MTVPLPLPLAPPVTVIQVAADEADHAQPPGAVTVTLPLPAAAPTLADVGEIVTEHDVPDCVTVNVSPAIVIVPVLGDTFWLAATRYRTPPPPVSLAPPMIVIQETLLVDVHAQPEGAVTSTMYEALSGPTLADVAESEYEHPGAACVTVNVCPPTVTVPARDAVPPLAATL